MARIETFLKSILPRIGLLGDILIPRCAFDSSRMPFEDISVGLRAIPQSRNRIPSCIGLLLDSPVASDSAELWRATPEGRRPLMVEIDCTILAVISSAVDWS